MFEESVKLKELKEKLLELEEKRNAADCFSEEYKDIIEEINKYGKKLFNEILNFTDLSIEALVANCEYHVSHTMDKFPEWCDYYLDYEHNLVVSKEYYDCFCTGKYVVDEMFIVSRFDGQGTLFTT